MVNFFKKIERETRRIRDQAISVVKDTRESHTEVVQQPMTMTPPSVQSIHRQVEVPNNGQEVIQQMITSEITSSVPLLVGDTNLTLFVNEASYLIDSQCDSLHSVTTRKVIRSNGHCSVSYLELRAERSIADTVSTVSVNIAILHAQIVVSAAVQIIDHKSKSNLWRSKSWSDSHTESRDLTAHELSVVHETLEESIRAHPDYHTR